MKFLTIISFILSFVAIIVSLFKCESMSVDWMSVIVGVLSILVTLLVGWNIFTALDFKKEIRLECEKLRVETQYKLHRHAELNEKDFNNIRKTLEKANSFCEKIDKALYEHISREK